MQVDPITNVMPNFTPTSLHGGHRVNSTKIQGIDKGKTVSTFSGADEGIILIEVKRHRFEEGQLQVSGSNGPDPSLAITAEVDPKNGPAVGPINQAHRNQ